jgi:hypothetical protein
MPVNTGSTTGSFDHVATDKQIATAVIAASSIANEN